MLSDTQLIEIQSRIEASKDNPLRGDTALLMSEVLRLKQATRGLDERVESRLAEIEALMLQLEAENERLRTVRESTYFERDACIGLLARMATALGIKAGTCQAEIQQENMDGKTSLQLQNRVVIDLPNGQVSWDYLNEDAHLFDALPAYDRPIENRSIRETYSTVMQPGDLT